MTIWRAIVPLKAPGTRKTRLATLLDADARDRLSDAMLDHVLAVLKAAPLIGDVMVLHGDGTDLNVQLAETRRPAQPTLVLFADLPQLTPADVAALLAAPASIMLAPDHSGLGTNAVAIRDGRTFSYAFGPGSLARHRIAAPDAAIVQREGLARDIDTPEDLRHWGGWRLPA